MIFQNRSAAGKLLARELEEYHNANAVVLALPRGGVEVGYEIARALNLPLDIISVRKIGHPQSSEYAIGVVDDKGELLINEVESSHVDQGWLKSEIERQQLEALRRTETYRRGHDVESLRRRIVIITDDGIATGYGMLLAVRSALRERPKKVVVAVPVAPPDAIAALHKMGAEIFVLEPPEAFQGSVGAHYVDFPQLTDEAVISSLHDIWQKGLAGRKGAGLSS